MEFYALDILYINVIIWGIIKLYSHILLCQNYMNIPYSWD